MLESASVRQSEAGGERPESIPIVIDAVRDIDGVSMARCMFLIIGSDEPLAGWTLAADSLRLPVLLLGMVGVIHRPAGAPRFRSADDIDAIFRPFGEMEGFSLELDDFWIPANVLEARSPDGVVRRGDLFRISPALFTAAYQFRQQRIAAEAFLAVAEAESATVERSDEEAGAFTAWNQRQIDAAREHYYANEAMALGWKGGA